MDREEDRNVVGHRRRYSRGLLSVQKDRSDVLCRLRLTGPKLRIKTRCQMASERTHKDGVTGGLSGHVILLVSLST